MLNNDMNPQPDANMYRLFTFQRREFFGPNEEIYDIRVYQNPVTKGFAVMILKAGNEMSDVRLMDEDTVKDTVTIRGTDSVTTLIDIVKSDIAADTFGKFGD